MPASFITSFTDFTTASKTQFKNPDVKFVNINVTPFEPEWEGYVTLEFSNTTPLPAKIYAGEGCAQVLFFGALLSAILSTASGTLLAPTAVITENVIQPLWGHKLSDRKMLVLLRLILIGFTCCVTLFALQSESSMYQMVQDAYKVTLVAAFTPLIFGMFWRRATPQGALLSMFCGVVAWQYAEHFMSDALVPAPLGGLGSAIKCYRNSRAR